MRKILIIFLIVFNSCDSNDSIKENTDPHWGIDEFVRLFPEDYPVTIFELDTGKSLVFHEKFRGKLKASLVNSLGEVEWTKEHNLANDVFINQGSTAFKYNNQIYIYTGRLGIHKYIFDLEANLITSETLSSEDDYFLQKDDLNIYAVRNVHGSNNSKVIDYIKYSLTGNLIEGNNFLYENNSYSSEIIIKNDLIYLFGESDFRSSLNFYENYYCSIFDLSGNLINRIDTETSNLKRSHSKLVLDNGNIIMSIYNFENINGFTALKDYEFRLFNLQGNLINSMVVNSSSNVLKLELLLENRFGLAGGRNALSTEPKFSQFSVFDSDLNQLYTKNIGSFDNGEEFFEIKESSESYYLLGRTDGTDGDFDLPNNSTTSDMFYFKLSK